MFIYFKMFFQMLFFGRCVENFEKCSQADVDVEWQLRGRSLEKRAFQESPGSGKGPERRMNAQKMLKAELCSDQGSTLSSCMFYHISYM